MTVSNCPRGSSLSWVSRNTSNTGSSKLRRQHANATAAVLDFDTTSSPAISLMISSTLRQTCTGPGGCVLLCRRDAKNSRSVPTLLGVGFKSSWSPLHPLRARARRSTRTVGGTRRSPPHCLPGLHMLQLQVHGQRPVTSLPCRASLRMFRRPIARYSD